MDSVGVIWSSWLPLESASGSWGGLSVAVELYAQGSVPRSEGGLQLKAIGYVRCSTNDQAVEGLSLPAQRLQISGLYPARRARKPSRGDDRNRTGAAADSVC